MPLRRSHRLHAAHGGRGPCTWITVSERTSGLAIVAASAAAEAARDAAANPAANKLILMPGVSL